MNPEIPIQMHLSVRELAALKRVVRGETGTGVLARDDQDFAQAVLRRVIGLAEASKCPDPDTEVRP